MSAAEEIPAYMTWKMLNETIQTLMNSRNAIKSVEQLAKILKSVNFSNIFLLEKNPNIPFVEYQDKAEKYKSFTTWLLGRFFYLLTRDNLSAKCHEVIIDIQLFILHQLSNTQLHVYEAMVHEYNHIFAQMIDSRRCGTQNYTISAFVPTKHDDLDLDLSPIDINITSDNFERIITYVVTFLKYILEKAFSFHCFNSGVLKQLDGLLFLLSQENFTIKLQILKLYVGLLHNGNVDLVVQRKMDIFICFLEQIVYEVYNEKFEINSKVEDFRNILRDFLEYSNDSERLINLSEFLRDKGLDYSQFNHSLSRSLKKNPQNNSRHLKSSILDYNIWGLCGFKNEIIKSVNKFQQHREDSKEIKMFQNEVCDRFSIFHDLFVSSLNQLNCNSSCKIQKFLQFSTELAKILTEVLIQFKNTVKISFFSDKELFLRIFRILITHLSICKETVEFREIFDFLLNFSFICGGSSLVLVFYVFCDRDSSENRRELGEFRKYLKLFEGYEKMCFQFLNLFMVKIASGLFEINQLEDIQMNYLGICKGIMEGQDDDKQVVILQNVPHLLTIFQSSDQILSEILNPALCSSNITISKATNQILHSIICISSCDFVKFIEMNEPNQFTVTILCDKCDLHIDQSKNPQKSTAIEGFLKNKDQTACIVAFSQINLDLSNLQGVILKNLLKSLTPNHKPELKCSSLEVLPYYANHITKFYSSNVTKMWAEICGDRDESVRKKFGEIVTKIIQHGEENTLLSEEIKSGTLEIFFSCLMKSTKKSLRTSDYKLQETLLYTMQDSFKIKSPTTVLPTMRILLYFIMLPTSKHSLIAVNMLFELAKQYSTKTSQIYRQYRQELCETIVHLCAVNQALVDFSLDTSLSKISVTLEFYNSKDFISSECQYLLPFLVGKIIKMRSVVELIKEVSSITATKLADLLTASYGNIFLHLFLNETKENFKQFMSYMEKHTALGGAALRKRNFHVIFNELLLNFHEKKENVLLALRLLSSEESESSSSNNVQDYLQSRFLGLLKHFDMKLLAESPHKKDKVLLSLADLFRFMGPKRIGPFRFKILAILRTVDYCCFPELICEVWDSFLRSCEPEALAPQLATIIDSVRPLIETNPKKVNEIFRYLVVENEINTQTYIKDLFFIEDKRIDVSVLRVIKKHVKMLEDCLLKEKIQHFLKYLKHETVEVRVKSLHFLKVAMEKSREDLDRMILSYNGIDPVVVELIEALTLGCRDSDEVLRLACGEVIGELGAVEPSHLPRRYSENGRFFTFLITDDQFIVNALSEFTNALQREKNTVNMDRFAVVIQEFLKTYDISPEESSERNCLWLQFSAAQQELMVPLLNSRYIIKHLPQADFPSPIYGTPVGASFQSWLFNWTHSLITSLSQENQALLTVCLPAMKRDQKILMHFLPHILLHSIIESEPHGKKTTKETAYKEINTVTTSFSNKRKLDENVLDVRPFSMSNVISAIETVTPEEEKQTECTKVVFIVLDFLNRWVVEWQWMNGIAGQNDKNYTNIKKFLSRFCKLQLARCNYFYGEFPRALLYMEDYIGENPIEISRHLSFLAEIYAQLDESDGVAGVTALQQTEPPIEQRILALEVSNKLSDAVSCYERMPQPLKLQHIHGLVRCYLDLDNVNTALNLARGSLDQHIEFGNMLLELQAEPLWRLGQYDDLDTLLKRNEMTENTSWGVQIGKALLAFKANDRGIFGEIVEKLKSQQVEMLGAATIEEGSYQRGYCYISRLHALNELQQVEKATYELLLKANDGQFVESVLKHLEKEWELRIKVVQQSVRIMEPLLCLRRVGIEQSKRIVESRVPSAVPLLNDLLGKCLLLSAKTARAAGVHQQAYSYIIKADEFAPPELFLEKAELHWFRDEHEQALTTLRRGVETISSNSNNSSINMNRLSAEAKLLIAIYDDSISNVDNDVKIDNYNQSVQVYKEWEKSWVCLGQFYDRIFQGLKDEDRDGPKFSSHQIFMINCFGKSLLYGTTYVYQSMPRLLSIWFDYGTRLLDVTAGSVRDERRNSLVKMTKLIDSFLERLPSYIFLTAFSQLVSRISHPQREVYLELKSIIVKLLLKYPQQTLWMMIPVIKSSYAVRAKRCAEIFSDPELKRPSMMKLVNDFTALAEKLIELCNKEVPTDVSTTTVSSLLRALPRMLSKNDFSEIMIPTHKFRKLVLPNPDFSSSQHDPFPNPYVSIVGIAEEVTLLHSLQRPRKIILRGSDGKEYIQMLKPKDDLRKDFRLMEFNDIVNQLLCLEPEARQRRLNIRLYSVAPLNEECGLIEWIPNLLGLRPILMTLYKQRGFGMTNRQLKNISCNNRDSLVKKRDVFTKVLLPKNPPILGEWFRRTFPDAQSWVFARTAYIRTTAVMSMVGYILGLGDRHGENILFDAICGDAVHVDFNCLFNKGESLDWPERVPFRLTHNMVAAMGPLGVEGIFRKSCACTLRVLRGNSNTLMSIVTPFVYDPLVSWPRNPSASTHNTAERTNEQAREHIKNIELRLQGKVRTLDRSLSIPLSVEGQTNNLINVATDIDNLCQMYIGWGPYL